MDDFEKYEASMEKRDLDAQREEIRVFLKKLGLSGATMALEMLHFALLNWCKSAYGEEAEIPTYYCVDPKTEKVVAKVVYHFGDYTAEKELVEEQVQEAVDAALRRVLTAAGLDIKPEDVIEMDPKDVARIITMNNNDEQIKGVTQELNKKLRNIREVAEDESVTTVEDKEAELILRNFTPKDGDKPN